MSARPSDRKDFAETAVATATFLGAGLFVGTLKDGQNFIYHGGVVRVRRQDLSEPVESDENGQVWRAGMYKVRRELAALQARSDIKPVAAAPLELCGCQDSETGDWLWMWRVPCVEVVTH